jgi:signal transduction histidine kinase
MALKLGLRLRIALVLAVACLLAAGGVGITLYSASEEMEDALIDQIVAEEMDYLTQRHQQNPAYQAQRSSNLQSFIVRSGEDDRALPAFLRSAAPGRHEFYIGNDEIHVLVRDQGDNRYYVAYEVGLHAQREREFRLLIVISTLTAALASLLLGYWISGLLVRQVTGLAARVGSMKPGQQQAQLIQPGQDPEIAMLARAFEDYQARIEQLIRREQEFTANASHELRTPLTAIRTSCELLLADTTLGEKSRARVEWINAAAGRMAEQVQALLFLARGQALGESEPVSLGDCVAEAVEPYRAELARKGLKLEIDIAPDAHLDLNYQALRLVLTNLVRNAVQHTERGGVRVAFSDRKLAVSDTGSGIEPADRPRLFERFYRAGGGRDGYGLGLAIVKRICDQYGWAIDVDSAPLCGSTFSVDFSASR